MSPSSFLRRIGTLACAVLFVWTNIATSVHMLAVGHAVCPEHGEILHVASTVSSAPSQSAKQHTPQALPMQGEQAHEVCGYAAPIRPTTAPTRLFVSPATPRDEVAARAIAVAPRRESIARILLAPKHSPPRCAPVA